MSLTRKEWYRRVGETWPETVPALTRDEAARAARRLYRYVMGRKFVGEVIQATGNRYTRVRHRQIVLNPEHATEGGWKGLIHMLSHYLAPELRHGGDHARLERRMIGQVLRRGWLEGKLKRAPKPKPEIDPRAEKLARCEAAIVRWERKLGRAQRALAKLKRKRARLLKARPAPLTLAKLEGSR